MAATGQDSGVLELNLKIIQSIELGTTKDYEVELDEDGGFIQIISTGRGSTWTAWTGETDRELGRATAARWCSVPFQTWKRPGTS